jgi:tRNA pseudouridine38-40 synthase
MIVESVEAPIDFHAIRDAIGKRYRYQMQLGGPRNAFLHRYHWRVKYRLDVDLLRRGAEQIVGKKDFACFQAAGGSRKSTVRDVRACDVVEEPWPAISDAFASVAPRVSIEVEADGFLYNMVRNIVGTLIEVARGRYQPEWIAELIAQGDRGPGGQTAPPEGLFLKKVDYLDFPEPFAAGSETAQPFQKIPPESSPANPSGNPPN